MTSTDGTLRAYGTDEEMNWALEDFLARTPGTASALLASTDGLARARAGMETDEADPVAATLSGLHSLARSLPGAHTGVQQVCVQLGDGLTFIMAAGEGSVLYVRARQEADPGVVGHSMAQLVGSLEEHLHTPARFYSASPR